MDILFQTSVTYFFIALSGPFLMQSMFLTFPYLKILGVYFISYLLLNRIPLRLGFLYGLYQIYPIIYIMSANSRVANSWILGDRCVINIYFHPFIWSLLYQQNEVCQYIFFPHEGWEEPMEQWEFSIQSTSNYSCMNAVQASLKHGRKLINCKS